MYVNTEVSDNISVDGMNIVRTRSWDSTYCFGKNGHKDKKFRKILYIIYINELVKNKDKTIR